MSSTLRIEASRLFWAHPNAYFVVEAYWLLDGGYPGYTCWDMGFLDHVQNVEIQWDAGTQNTICPRPDGRMEIQQDRITTFWTSFTQRFPNAKRVLVNYTEESPIWWKDTKPVIRPLRILMQSCPPELEVYVQVLEEQPLLVDPSTIAPSTKKKWQRSVYQPSAGSVWAKVELNGVRNTILMPMKRFDGPVGESEQLKYKYSQILLQKYALWPLMVEVVARQNFDGGNDDSFSYPSFARDEHFTKAVAWIVMQPSRILERGGNLKSCPTK